MEKTVSERIPREAIEAMMQHIDIKKVKKCGWIAEAIMEKIEREKYYESIRPVKYGPTEFK